jgi:hypothetical protein
VAEETRKERSNRELIELLNELRVALPGVQVLFAFMITVPFTSGFAKTTAFQRDVFFVAFLATATASALFIAPSAFHRLRFRVEDKERIVLVSNGLAIGGLLFLVVAIVAVVLLVSDFIFGRTTAVAATATIGSVLVILWFGLAFGAWLRDR